MPSRKKTVRKPDVKTVQDLLAALDKQEAFGFWANISASKDSMSLARQLREAQIRY